MARPVAMGVPRHPLTDLGFVCCNALFADASQPKDKSDAFLNLV